MRRRAAFESAQLLQLSHRFSNGEARSTLSLFVHISTARTPRTTLVSLFPLPTVFHWHAGRLATPGTDHVDCLLASRALPHFTSAQLCAPRKLPSPHQLRLHPPAYSLPTPKSLGSRPSEDMDDLRMVDTMSAPQQNSPSSPDANSDTPTTGANPASDQAGATGFRRYA